MPLLLRGGTVTEANFKTFVCGPGPEGGTPMRHQRVSVHRNCKCASATRAPKNVLDDVQRTDQFGESGMPHLPTWNYPAKHIH